MTNVPTLLRWDWFKLARRWMPWILLVVLLLMSQLAVWGNYFRYQNLRSSGGILTGGSVGSRFEVRCDDLLSGKPGAVPAGTSQQVIQGLQAQCQQAAAQTQQQLNRLADGFSLPGSLPAALGVSLGIGLILFAVLTASVFGAEYGWGTIRPALVRGTGRWPYLAAKLLLLLLLALAALIVVVAVSAVSSVFAHQLAGSPAITGATTWGSALRDLGKMWVGLVPYIVFSMFITVLTRSSATGMALGIGYYLAEQIIVAILSGLFSWFGTIAKYLLGQNITAWSGVSIFGQGQTSVSTLHALLVLVGYTLVLGGGAFYLFQTRDISGAA
ncbi:MAG TPA: ABC transporter permease subunit [Thermomicrobiaceae bacterium]|nr:ABC transporter permease subunit [Thermomicrobiaceae bacterium]